MTQVYTYPERKEIFADNVEELQTKAEELAEDGFAPLTKICKAMGTYRQTFFKQAETDQALFPSVEPEKEAEEGGEGGEGGDNPTPEPEDPKKPLYGFIFYTDESSEEVVNLYDEDGYVVDDPDTFIGTIASYEVITPDPNGKPKYYIFGDTVSDKTWGYYDIKVGTNQDYNTLGKGKEATQLILNTQDTSAGYENSIWKALVEYNTANTHGNDWYIGNETEMSLLCNYIHDWDGNIFSGDSDECVGSSTEYMYGDDYESNVCVMYNDNDGSYSSGYPKETLAKWAYIRSI